MKKNIIIIVLSVVALLLAGTVGYLIAETAISNKYEIGDVDNTNKENEEKEETKELEINDILVTSLIYPMNRINNLGYKDHWNYKNETIETLGRSRMMYNAAFELGFGSDKVYYASVIKSNFAKIFGPDATYYDGDIEEVESCLISKYDVVTQTYTAGTGCGGATIGFVDSVTKKYKVEQNNDYIYVYEYVKSVWVGPKDTMDWQSPIVVYLVDKNYEKTTILEGATESNYESIIEQMMNKGEVDTYKWTFKKQSDGKYYFYSGAWEN